MAMGIKKQTGRTYIYSNKRSCQVISTHITGHFSETQKHISSIATGRAGNVIGGGDWANDRIIVDCIKLVKR